MSASVYFIEPIFNIGKRLAALPLLVCLVAAAPAPSDDDLYARGDALSSSLMKGDVATLERAMTPQFVKGIGGREALAKMAGQLKTQAGAEVQVLERSAYLEAGHVAYYRVSRFERVPSMTSRWVFDKDGRVAALSMRPTVPPAPSKENGSRIKARFSLPFGAATDGHWYVAWGGDDHVSNKHVGAPDQRYAYDFVVARGRDVYQGEGKKNEDHFCWNEPLFAPAVGVVVRAVDGVADNNPGAANPNAPPPGNHVVLDHGSGAYSFIAHLRLGSLAVREGQKVTPRTMLGRCGNSGRSDLPHVHYHVQTAVSYGEGEGIPVTFGGYFNGAKYVSGGRPVRGEYLTPAKKDLDQMGAGESARGR